MTKEEMKDRISMALKDPMLQQGFEIICKENAELKKEVEKHKWNDIFLEESAFYDKKIAEEYTTLQERIAELEKENAELKDKLNNLSKVAEVRLANWQKYEQENAELKNQVSYLGDNLRVARKDRENLQLDVAKGLKEFVKDYPATAFRYLANEKYVEKLTKAKEIILKLYNAGRDVLMCRAEEKAYDNLSEAISDRSIEQFLSEVGHD